MSNRENRSPKEKRNKNKIAIKPEHLVYAVLGLVVAAVVILVIVVAVTTGAETGGNTTVPPCCR